MRKKSITINKTVPENKYGPPRSSDLPQANSEKIPENYNNHSLAWTTRDLAFVEAHYGVIKTTELAKELGRSVASIRIIGGRLAREKAGNCSTQKTEKYRNHRSVWTVRELQFVKSHYGVMKAAKIAEKLGRTVVSVRLTAQSLGCCKIPSSPWTKEEEDIIRKEYACGSGSTKIMDLLPGRTWNAIVLRASKMKIINTRTKIWSEEEQQLLKQYYPTMGTRVAEIIPGRTEVAVKAMAYSMAITFEGSKESGRRVWSEQEKILLDTNQHLPQPELLALFPERSPSSIRQALTRLKARRAAEKHI
ncbi:hypothetical protein DER63_13830 [Salmonella enterica]|nr:hypothetical protein [Salmonella enterica]